MTVHIYSFVFLFLYNVLGFFCCFSFSRLYIFHGHFAIVVTTDEKTVTVCQSDPVHVNLCRTCMWTNQLVRYCAH